jgi:GT2 family glycosyltransferase
MPVHDPPPEFLERAVQTVRAQTYSHWQLCIADDGSCDARVHAVLDEILAGGDERIVVARRPHGGISAASNAALDLATGDYVALLDHDDEIEPDALAAIAEHLRAHPDTDVVYTDEDRVLADGTRFGQVLKPDWSPELLGGGMYACHLIVYRRELIERAGRFRGDYDGSQDFDLLLRIADHTDRVGHVPRVLYHWRAHSASVAIDHRSKPYAFDAAERALSEHLRRRGIDGAVQRTALPGLYRTVHRRTPGETASIIVGWDPRAAGAAAPAALRRAVAQLARGTDGTCELICAVPDDQATACAQALAGAGEGRMRLVKAGKVPAPGDLLERGARAATGEHLVLLAAPCAPAGAGWLGELLGFSRRDGIGAVGAKVLDREGRVAHGGIVLPDGVPLAAYRGVPADSMGNIGTLVVACNYSAVDGVVATRSELFARLGGLREADADLALIDYCIRAGAEGRRTVFAPAAMLVLADAAPRPPIPLAALARLQQRFRARHRRDPYYNPAFSSLRAELPTPPVPPAAVGA